MSSDQMAYNQSMEQSGAAAIMQDKKWLEVMDESNGSYDSSQSTLTTTSLSTSDRLINYKEAYLCIPLVLTLAKISGTEGLAFSATDDVTRVMGLKNSYTSLIHSMSVDLAGTNVIQNTPFSEMYNSFVLNTTLSWDDVKTQGASIGFYPDEACSAADSSTATEGGVPASTIYNNRTNVSIDDTNDVVLSCPSGSSINTGFVERMKYINFDPTVASLTVGYSSEPLLSATLLTLANAKLLHKNCIYNKVVTAGSEVIQTQINAIVKLKHLHNFFVNIPMARGLNFRFIINFNSCTSTISKSAAGFVVSEAREKNSFGGMNPIMIANADDGQGGHFFATGTSAIVNHRVDLSIGTSCLDSTISSRCTASSLNRSVTLHVPAYVLDPGLASAYLSSSTNRKVTYTDIYQFKLAGVGGGSTYNSLVTNGIRGIKSILVMPMTHPDSNNGLAEYHSVFSDGLPCPHAQQSNFQIMIGGVNQLQNGSRYEAHTFIQHVYGCNSTNAGQTDGLNSGLIDQRQWASKYLYYYVDVNRGTSLETDVPKSIQLSGLNNSEKKVDLFCFVEFEQSINIDCSSGAIVS